MKRNRLKNRQRLNLSFRMRIIIGASVFLAASFILIIIFHLGEVKDSNAAVTGEYRTVGSGNWDDQDVWEVFDGSTWKPADSPSAEEIAIVTVTTGKKVVLNDEVTLKKLVIEEGAKLEIKCNYVKVRKEGNAGGIDCKGSISLGEAIIEGDGDFVLAKGAEMFIGSDAGIDKKAVTGNIQLTGKRELNKDATYIFNGTINQRTGNGLPVLISNLIIDNSSGVDFDQNISVTGSLELKKGVLNTGAFQLTLGVSSQNTAELKNQNGSVCGKIKCWYGKGNADNLSFHLSDGNSVKKFNFISDVSAYRKGLFELIYKPGIPDDTKKSPYEARHVVAGIFSEGFYSVSLSNGPDEAWLKFVSSKTDSKGEEVIIWNISSRNLKDIIPEGSGQNSDKTGTEKNFSNLITGPNPFNRLLVVRFHSESGGIVHLAMVNKSGKVIYNEKINAVSGYNQFTFEPREDLEVGDYMIQLSNISEIQTIKATKAQSPNGAS